MIIGTAGHIDHGKTSLVRALTGVDTDRLAEERRRGISIDLGYAYAPAGHGEILGFVDVPGHERFIHNMLAGATGVDFALLVIAADDGPMPQTVEHLQIIDLLGIRQGAVAITKIDRVDAGRIGKVALLARTLTADTALSGCPVFPVSTATGQGLPVLRAHLVAAAAGAVTPKAEGCFRLAVDRCFSLAGIGTVVTGTVFSGQVAVGDHLLVSPSGLPVRVRGIHAQNRQAETGRAGQRCALNLAHAAVPDIRRGDWIVTPAAHAPTHRLDVRLRLLAAESRPLRHWTPVHIHLGAFHATGRVALLGEEPVPPGGSVLAQLVLDATTPAMHGDRAVLRDASARHIVAGARVLDAQPPARGRRTPRRLAVLAALEQPDPQAIMAALADASPDGVNIPHLRLNTGWSDAAVGRLAASLELIRIAGERPLLFTSGHLARLRQAITEALAREHASAPDAPGLNAEQLRLRTAPRLDRDAFRNVLADLAGEGHCVKDGPWWHLPGHAATLSPADEALWQRIAPLLVRNPSQPPRVRDIARTEAIDETEVRRVLGRAARQGLVHRVAHDHYFDRQAAARLAEAVRQLAAEFPAGAVTAAAFRDRIGTGRKLAIQILEFFDRQGLTRRINDAHVIRSTEIEF